LLSAYSDRVLENETFSDQFSADRTQSLWIDGVIGELLYVPEGWHHATLNYGETLAVAQQARIGRSEWLRLRLLGTQLANARAFAEASEVMEATLDKYPDRGGISHNVHNMFWILKTRCLPK